MKPSEAAPAAAAEASSSTPNDISTDLAPKGSDAERPLADEASAAVEGGVRLSILTALVAGISTLLRRRKTEEAPVDGGGAAVGEEELASASEPFANAVDFNPLPREAGVPESSDKIFAEIGGELRARREMLSLTYEEIERHTRVRAAFLRALEEGAMEGLPSPVQTRGILANYAAFIDLDVDAVLLRFADGVQARHREKNPNWPPRVHTPMTVNKSLPPLRSFIASDLLFGGGAAIMLILFAVWGINRVMAVRAATPPRATAPSISDVLAVAPVATVPSEITLIAPQDTPLVPPTAIVQEVQMTPLDPTITVQVKLTSSERTYLRVMVDDKTAFEGRTEPGKDYYYQATRRIEVLVGNAAALRVVHNGRELGLMGNFGQVVDELFTAEGVFTPTATLPPTRTPSATPTETPRATPTLATYTPTPKNAGQ